MDQPATDREEEVARLLESIAAALHPEPSPKPQGVTITVPHATEYAAILEQCLGLIEAAMVEGGATGELLDILKRLQGAVTVAMTPGAGGRHELYLGTIAAVLSYTAMRHERSNLRTPARPEQGSEALSVQDLQLRIAANVQTQVEAVVKTMEAQVEAATEAARAAKAAASTAGAEVRTKEFADRATAHRDASTGWLKAAMAAFAAWTGAAYYIATSMPAQATWPDVAVRILGLSAGLAMVNVLVRAYTANRHNAVVNEHRSTAINTMRTFISAATDEATKNAVILQVTAGTFAPLPTGYEGRGGAALPQVQVIELLKSGKRSDG